jgi:hypothetical protein
MKSTWSIVFPDGGAPMYFHGDKEVSEAEYRAAHPSRFHEVAAAGTVRIRPPKDSGWESENGGRGRYIGQLGKPNDPKCYHRSVASAKEEARRQGWAQIEDA